MLAAVALLAADAQRTARALAAAAARRESRAGGAVGASCLSAHSRCGCGAWPWCALRERLREVLVALADGGVVDLSGPLGQRRGAGAGGAPAPGAAHARRRAPRPGTRPASAPDIEQLERAARETCWRARSRLERRSASAVRHGGFALFVGWAPAPALTRAEPAGWSARGLGGGDFDPPRGAEPPTLLAPAPAAEPFRPLLSTYGAVPYEDLDPTPFAAVTYCLMFGMMFGDVGDGAVIVLAALVLRRLRHPRLQALRKVWPMIAAAGPHRSCSARCTASCSGRPSCCRRCGSRRSIAPPACSCSRCSRAACLLAAGYLIGIVNRWREGGRALALTSGTVGCPGWRCWSAADWRCSASPRHARVWLTDAGAGARSGRGRWPAWPSGCAGRPAPAPRRSGSCDRACSTRCCG